MENKMSKIEKMLEALLQEDNFCNQCGAALIGDEFFCPECGAEVTPSNDEEEEVEIDISSDIGGDMDISNEIDMDMGMDIDYDTGYETDEYPAVGFESVDALIEKRLNRK